MVGTTYCGLNKKDFFTTKWKNICWLREHISYADIIFDVVKIENTINFDWFNSVDKRLNVLKLLDIQSTWVCFLTLCLALLFKCIWLSAYYTSANVINILQLNVFFFFFLCQEIILQKKFKKREFVCKDL